MRISFLYDVRVIKKYDLNDFQKKKNRAENGSIDNKEKNKY